MTLAVIAFALALTGCTAEVSSRPTSTPTKTVTVTATPDPVDVPVLVNNSEVLAAIGATKDGIVPMPDDSWCEVFRVLKSRAEIEMVVAYGDKVAVNKDGTVGVMWGGDEEEACFTQISMGLIGFEP